MSHGGNRIRRGRQTGRFLAPFLWPHPLDQWNGSPTADLPRVVDLSLGLRTPSMEGHVVRNGPLSPSFWRRLPVGPELAHGGRARRNWRRGLQLADDRRNRGIGTAFGEIYRWAVSIRKITPA
ncbi:hypothetical protein HPP92_007568 [Vanilla planifolia]|nr:hypothetical protein HPP92_007568 [Vanilla planifolia]